MRKKRALFRLSLPLALCLSFPSWAVIILPENVDWSKTPNWLEEVTVQETEPLFEEKAIPEEPSVREPLVRIRLHVPERIPVGVVTLEDVATIECEDEALYSDVSRIDLGASPSPGETLFVFPRRIEAALRAMGLHHGDFAIEGPERIRIHGESQTVSMEQIEEAIDAALEARAQEGPGGEVEAYLLHRPTPFFLPPGELEIEVVDLDRPGSGIRQIQLAFLVDGKKIETKTYAVRVNHKTYGLVAKRDLQPGDRITPEDLTEGLIPVDSEVARKNVVYDPELLLGTRVLQPVAMGHPITEKDVEREPIRSRGDRVTLVQRFGKVQTTAPGELLEDAVKIGQTVRVRKTKSRKTFVGRLVSPWEVEVR